MGFISAVSFSKLSCTISRKFNTANIKVPMNTILNYFNTSHIFLNYAIKIHIYTILSSSSVPHRGTLKQQYPPKCCSFKKKEKERGE
jgi:hypothetical protein